jgi:hypothetical protein
MNEKNTGGTDAEIESETGDKNPNPHWPLLGRLISFQFKLIMDGLRDLLLSPISIVFTLYGIVLQRDRPDKYFNRLMRFGRKSDDFINLFGEHEGPSITTTDNDIYNSDNSLPPESSVNLKSKTSDDYVKKLEELILMEYGKGGFISGIKHGTDDLLAKLQKKAKKSQTNQDKLRENKLK